MNGPFTIVASGFDTLVYVIAAVVWVIFQLVSHAAKNAPRPPPGTRPPPPARRPVSEDLQELFDQLSGQKSESPPTTPPVSRPPLIQIVPRPAPASRSTVATSFRRPPSRRPPPTRVPLPMPPVSKPVAAPMAPAVPAAAVPVFDPYLHRHAATVQPQMHIAPLIRMRWPGSPFANLIIADTGRGRISPLRQMLIGRVAFRRAMVSRIILGPPGGR